MAVTGKAVNNADTEEEDDPWSTGTGMADDFDGYIAEPFFGTDEQYNAEAVLFCANLVAADGTPITMLKYSVGAGWVPSDDGATLSHPQKTKINESSRFGFFIDRIAQPTNIKAPKHADVESPKGAGNGLGLGPILKQRGNPLEAKSFDGLGFHWNLHSMKTMGTDAATGARIVKQTLLPTAYLGEAKGATNGAGTPAAARSTTPVATAKPGAAAPAAAASGGADIAIPAEIRRKFTPMATSSDVRTFVRNASKDTLIINAPDDVMNHLLDGGPNGFWASVQG